MPETGPDLDLDKLEVALADSGLPLEVSAFVTALRRGWRAVHGMKYASGEKTREIDVFASQVFDFYQPSDAKREVKGSLWVPVEAKWAQQFWVFIDLDGRAAPPNEFFHPPHAVGLAEKVLAKVVKDVLDEWRWDHQPPPRATSVRELSFAYDKGNQEQVYAASQQALSGMRGVGPYFSTGAFSSGARVLSAFMPTVVTSRRPILARLADDGSAFEFSEHEWIVSGDRDEIVHVVSEAGFELSLGFAEAVIAGLQAPATRDFVEGLFRS